MFVHKKNETLTSLFMQRVSCLSPFHALRFMPSPFHVECFLPFTLSFSCISSPRPFNLSCSCTSIQRVSCLSPFHLSVFREFHAFHPFIQLFLKSFMTFTLSCICIQRVSSLSPSFHVPEFREFYAFHPFMQLYRYLESVTPLTLLCSCI